MAGEKILIVDDDPDLTVALQAILDGEGYRTSIAPGCSEARTRITLDCPDLIVLDVMMTTWDEGFEMARQLKSEPATERIPILMLTGIRRRVGIDFKSSAGDGTWCPVDGFLDKPVDPDVLLTEVRGLLQRPDG